jgi:hypothetical protein
MYKKIKNILSSKAFFLLLLPIFFIYSAYNELFGFLTAGFVMINFCAVLLFTFLIYFIAFSIVKHRTKASILTLLATAYCLLFGYIHDSVKSILPAGSFFASFTFVLPFSLLLIVLLILFLKCQKNKTYADTFFYFNLLITALILSEIPNSIKRYNLDKSVHNLIDFRFAVASSYSASPKIKHSNPDIYFLLFDGMASTKSLREGIGKDNSKLDSFLLQEGFYIAGDAKANYNWTIHSLSTTFNMDYLPDFIAPVMNDPKAYFWGTNSFLSNSLTRILQTEGYQINQFQPISLNNDDWPAHTYFQYMKDQHFFFKTLPGRIYRDIFWNYTSINNKYIKNIQLNVKRKRYKEQQLLVETAASLVKKSCSKDGLPKFVYTHLMIPHDPYIFTRDGKLKEIALGKKEDEPEAYFEQLLYANSLIRELVHYIKTNNKENTVIIIAGDHGFRNFKKMGVENVFGNLNAFYFPDQNYTKLYDSITPVNTFRVVLNTYFNANLPLLKDSSIIVSDQKNTIIQSKLK